MKYKKPFKHVCLSALITIIVLLVVVMCSCNIPDPSVPDFVWNGFGCKTHTINDVDYVEIIGLTSDMSLEDNFVFPTEINGYEVRRIGRGKIK